MSNDKLKDILQENGIISSPSAFTEKLAARVAHNYLPITNKKTTGISLGSITMYLLVFLNLLVLCILGATQLEPTIFISLLLFSITCLVTGWLFTKLFTRHFKEKALINISSK